MLFGFFTLAAACERAPSHRRSRDEPASIALRPYFRDLRVVHAVAGTDTLTMLLDTGGGTTLLTPQRAQRLGCIPRGGDVGHRMTGEVVVFARCDSMRIAIDSFETLVAPVGVFDINALLPAERPRLDGVVALDAFVGRVITIDWAADKVTVHGSGAADAAAREAVPFRDATGIAGRFHSVLLPVEGRFGRLWFLLDSGNLRGTLVSTAVLRDSLLEAHSTLRIADRAYDSLPIIPADLAIDGVLGTDFLRRGPVTLDLRAIAQTR